MAFDLRSNDGNEGVLIVVIGRARNVCRERRARSDWLASWPSAADGPDGNFDGTAPVGYAPGRFSPLGSSSVGGALGQCADQAQ
jgi:hypothetical protein